MNIYVSCVGVIAAEYDTKALMIIAVAAASRNGYGEFVLRMLQEWEFDLLFIEEVMTVKIARNRGLISDEQASEILRLSKSEASTTNKKEFWYTDAETFIED